jgi:hypothetical protein
MQCILYKIYFWKVFRMYYKLICILYALLCGQNFILVKMGVTNLPLLEESRPEIQEVLGNSSG